MDKQPLRIVAIIAVIVLAVAALAFGMKTVSKSEDYTPSPGGQGGGTTASGPPPGAVPQMPGGPPPGVAPGTVMDKK